MSVTSRDRLGRPAGGRARTLALGWATVLALALVPSAGHPASDTTSVGASPATTPAPGEHDPGVSRASPLPARPRSFTLVATGDVLLHTPLWRQAEDDARAAGRTGFDFRPLLGGVQPYVSEADLALCHLETPIAPPGGPYSSYPSFSVPPDIAPALADTGYDACSTASNHTFDRGGDGVDRTLAALDAAGLRHAGSARDPGEAAAVTLLPVAGIEVALLSYTYGFNGIPPPGGQDWRSNPIDGPRILGDAARARAEGAEVVVVALHWGDEYRAEPNAQQRDLAPMLVRSPDVDLVLGHHAHVVQPIEQVDGEWVVYGMGNLVAHHGTGLPANEEGLLVRFTFTEVDDGWRVSRAEYAALMVAKDPPIRVVDVGAALGAGAVDPPGAPRLQEAWDRTAAVVGSLGAAAAGLRSLPAPPGPGTAGDPPAGPARGTGEPTSGPTSEPTAP